MLMAIINLTNFLNFDCVNTVKQQFLASGNFFSYTQNRLIACTLCTTECWPNASPESTQYS